jgi:hypothetical protein
MSDIPEISFPYRLALSYQNGKTVVVGATPPGRFLDVGNLLPNSPIGYEPGRLQERAAREQRDVLQAQRLSTAT